MLSAAVDRKPVHASGAQRRALWNQYAVFIYRSLESFSNTVAGTWVNVSDYSAHAKLLARTVNLMLRCGELLPEEPDVLPSTEALCAALFHVAVCNRPAYWGALAFAHEQCFATLAADAADLADTPAQREMQGLFARALDDMSTEIVAPALDPRLAVRVAELVALIHRETAAQMSA